MRDFIDAVTAQQLSIQILTCLTPTESLVLLEKAEASPDTGRTVPADLRHLRHCIALGSELREDPHRYDRLEQVCTAILRRSTSREKVRKSEYGEALGVTNKMQRRRLERGEASLTPEQITGICSAFGDSTLRRFWENMLYGLDPGISTAGRDAGPEPGTLQLLCALLTQAQYQRLPGCLREQLASPPPAVPSRFGEQPDRLYAVINTLAGALPILIPDLAEQEIGVHMNTWYAWRRAWTEAEETGFRTVPQKRLKRVHMMILSVLFSASYPESIALMALAGYRYVSGEPDSMVTAYLQTPQDPLEAEALRNRLREDFYTGKWQRRS